MKLSKKRIAVIAVLVLTLFLAAGCNAGNNQEPVVQLNKITVLLDWTPNTNHTGIYAARELGYYKDRGLDVEIVQPSEGGTSQLIAAGQGDFGFSYQEEVTIARTKGLPVKALAAVIQHNTSGFASPVEKGIETPKDFEGKKYGGWGSPAEEAMIKALMNRAGADFSRVEMINIGTSDFFTSIAKDVDFAWIYWGWTGIESGLRDVPLNFIRLTDYSAVLDFYSPVLIAAEGTVADRPELVAAFIAATAQGYEYCIEHPQEAGQILLDSVPELNAGLVLASQEYLAGQYRADAAAWGQMSAARWENYAAWMYEQGLIEQPLAAEKAFTNEFLPGE